jgi:hypothetical protein
MSPIVQRTHSDDALIPINVFLDAGGLLIADFISQRLTCFLAAQPIHTGTFACLL